MLKVSALANIVSLNRAIQERLSLRAYLDQEKNRQLLLNFYPLSNLLLTLQEILQQMHREPRDRNHLIFGNSGLSKTYLAVLLANLLGGAAGQAFIRDKLSEWAKKAPELPQLIAKLNLEEKSYLIIPVEKLEKEDDLQVQLLSALNGALYRRGIDYVPPAKGYLPEILRETLNQLKQNPELKGMVILLDSAQAHLREKPKDLQALAECCRTSAFPCFLFTFASLSPQTAMQFDQNPFDRVHQLSFLSPDYAMENFLAEVVFKFYRPEDRLELSRERELKILMELLKAHQLYPNQPEEWKRNRVLLDCYPFHPLALFFLPRMAEQFGAPDHNLRTLLSDEVPGALPNLIHNLAFYQPNGRLALYHLDTLFSYFERNLKSSPEYSELLEYLERIRPQIIDLPFSSRILRVIAAFQLMANPRFLPTSSNILEALHLSEKEVPKVRETLRALAEKELLQYENNNDQFLLSQGLPKPKDSKAILAELKQTVAATYDFSGLLSRNFNLQPIIPEPFNKKHYTDKTTRTRFALFKELASPRLIQEEIAALAQANQAEYQGDLLILYLIPAQAEQIEIIKQKVKAGELDNPGLLLAFCKKIPQVIENYLEIEVLRKLLTYQMPFCDPDYEDRGELLTAQQELSRQLQAKIKDLLSADNFFWCWKKNIREDIARGKEEELVSEIFNQAFSSFPVVGNRVLSQHKESQENNQLKRAALLLLLDPAELLELPKKDLTPAQQLLKSWLVSTGLLKKARELEDREAYLWNLKPPRESSLFGLWNLYKETLLGSQRGSKRTEAEELYHRLCLPPFGIPAAMMEFFLAFFLRGFPANLQIYKKEGEIPETLPSPDFPPQKIIPELLTELFKKPENYFLLYCEVRDEKRELLDFVRQEFISSGELTPQSNIWDEGKMALLKWYDALPPLAKDFSEFKSQYAVPLLSLLADKERTFASEPLLTNYLVSALGFSASNFGWQENLAELKTRLKSTRDEISAFEEKFKNLLLLQIAKLLGAEKIEDLPAALSAWENTLAAQNLETPPAEALGLLREALKESEKLKEILLVKLPQRFGWGRVSNWSRDYTPEYIERLKFLKFLAENWKSSWTYPPQEESEKQAKVKELAKEFLASANLPAEKLEDLLSGWL